VITFLLGLAGGLAVTLSNAFADDGTLATKPGILNSSFGVLSFLALALTGTPPLHALLVVAPFLVGMLVVPASGLDGESFLGKLAVFAPHALGVFLTDHYITSAADASKVVTAQNVLTFIAAIICFANRYTSVFGVAIMSLASLLIVPFTLSFGDAAAPISAGLSAVLVFSAVLSVASLALSSKHKNGPLVVRPALPSTRRCVPSLLRSEASVKQGRAAASSVRAKLVRSKGEQRASERSESIQGLDGGASNNTSYAGARFREGDEQRRAACERVKRAG
jgi:hypothetical protein